MKLWLLKLLGYNTVVPQRAKQQLVQGRYPVTEAFALDGTMYYQFSDQFNVPAGRFLAIFAAFEELNSRCDREYLELFCKAIERVLSERKINLQTISQLNLNLKERLDIMPTEDFIYKFMSVLFFDETEKLDEHDYEYAKVKIARWKKDPSAMSFFLSKPIQEQMPSLNIPTENSQIFLELAKKIDATHRANILKVLSAN